MRKDFIKPLIAIKQSEIPFEITNRSHSSAIDDSLKLCVWGAILIKRQIYVQYLVFTSDLYRCIPFIREVSYKFIIIGRTKHLFVNIE